MLELLQLRRSQQRLLLLLQLPQPLLQSRCSCRLELIPALQQQIRRKRAVARRRAARSDLLLHLRVHTVMHAHIHTQHNRLAGRSGVHGLRDFVQRPQKTTTTTEKQKAGDAMQAAMLYPGKAGFSWLTVFWAVRGSGWSAPPAAKSFCRAALSLGRHKVAETDETATKISAQHAQRQVCLFQEPLLQAMSDTSHSPRLVR